jgi:SAM-dependent methyltransferase
MTVEPWSERAEAYVESDAHREGEDLDLLVEWAAGAARALDVATGGGHVGRRLREAGLEVVTCDPAPGMRADVTCRAESLPFADDAFEVVACRTAAHHFEDVRAALVEMARVSSDRVLIVDTLHMGDDVEEAALTIEEVRVLEHPIDFVKWLERTGCTGETAAEVEVLLGERVADGRLILDKLAIRTLKGR